MINDDIISNIIYRHPYITFVPHLLYYFTFNK